MFLLDSFLPLLVGRGCAPSGAKRVGGWRSRLEDHSSTDCGRNRCIFQSAGYEIRAPQSLSRRCHRNSACWLPSPRQSNAPQTKQNPDQGPNRNLTRNLIAKRRGAQSQSASRRPSRWRAESWRGSFCSVPLDASPHPSAFGGHPPHRGEREERGAFETLVLSYPSHTGFFDQHLERGDQLGPSAPSTAPGSRTAYAHVCRPRPAAAPTARPSLCRPPDVACGGLITAVKS